MRILSVCCNTLLLVCLTGAVTALADKSVELSPNGIELPKDYKDWRVISSSHRIDINSMRVILGNDISIEAARSGKTNPWPEGAILAKLVWEETKEQHWRAAIAPGKFTHAEFMVKNTALYQSTGGWGYARWLGIEQKPYGKNANFVQECVACHTPVKHRDWVYTTPAVLP